MNASILLLLSLSDFCQMIPLPDEHLLRRKNTHASDNISPIMPKETAADEDIKECLSNESPQIDDFWSIIRL